MKLEKCMLINSGYKRLSSGNMCIIPGNVLVKHQDPKMGKKCKQIIHKKAYKQKKTIQYLFKGVKPMIRLSITPKH